MTDATPSREEMLISRAVEHAATAAEWAELERMASSDAGLWRRLGESMRDQTELESALNEYVDAIDYDACWQRGLVSPAPAEARAVSRIRLVQWTGWAAAAAVALAWVIAMPGREAAVQPAAQHASWSSDEAFDHYIDRAWEEGRIVGQLPLSLLETRPSADGTKTEILYLRQLIERAEVEGVQEIRGDDSLESILPGGGGEVQTNGTPLQMHNVSNRRF